MYNGPVTRNGARLLFCASALLALPSCKRAEPGATGLHLDLVTADPTPLPTTVKLSWIYAQGEVLEREIPGDGGKLEESRADRITVYIEIPGDVGGERRVLARGYRDGLPVSVGAARLIIPSAAWVRFELRLEPTLPDADKDDLPDVIDDCPDWAGPCGQMPDAAVGSDQRDAAGGGGDSSPDGPSEADRPVQTDTAEAPAPDGAGAEPAAIEAAPSEPAPRDAAGDLRADGLPPGNGSGLRGEYFDNADLTLSKLSRADMRIDFDWGNGNPDPVIGPDSFSVRWTGKLLPRFSETYTFYTLADDGMKVWIDDMLLIDAWMGASNKEMVGTIALEGGRLYRLRVEHREDTGMAQAKLSWSSPSEPRAIVPQSQLFPE